jgi:hypothetical protein
MRDQIDYSNVDDAALARLERDVIAVLAAYGTLCSDTPEWMDDLRHEHWRIVQEINRRTGSVEVAETRSIEGERQ